MNRIVYIENEMPLSLHCKGLNYDETKHLSMQDLTMFIERDLHCYLKKLKELNPTFSISLIKQEGFFEVRIQVSIAFINAAEPVRRRIESLLWLYNTQSFIQKNGHLVALPSRFRFEIDVTQHMN